MKLFITLALVALASAIPNDDYSRYDNFNLDEVLDNHRLLSAYSKCFTGDGKCTAESSEFKKWIPDALKTSCGKCSEKQKILVARVIKALTEKLIEDWKKLNDQHNPDGKYDEQIKEFVKQYSPN